jgi:hypothetical protein
MNLTTVNNEGNPTPPLQTPPPPTPPAETLYERRFSTLERLLKILTSPAQAMKDIAETPNYTEPTVMVIIQAILAAVSVVLVMQKIKIIGAEPTLSTVQNILVGVLAFAVIFAGILLFVFWLGKSLLVKVFCNSQSNWDFKTAAAITGYAYMPVIVIGVIGLIVTFFLLPSFTIDVTNLDAARSALSNYQTQLNSLKFLVSLPLSLVGLVWQSYVGGLGAHFGTKGKCTVTLGFTVFLILGLLGLAFSYIFGR